MIDAVMNTPQRITRWLPAPVTGSLREARRCVSHLKNSLVDRQPKLLVLVYHRVLPYRAPNPLNTIVSRDTFTRQLEIIARRYPTISLGETVTQCRSGRAKAGVQVVLTFDDGYWDNYEVVLPILEAKGIPAAFFLATDYLEAGRPLWDWEVVMRLERHPDVTRLEVGETVFQQHRGEPRLLFALRFLEALKASDPETLQRVLETLTRQNGAGAYNPTDDRCMTWDQVRTMSRRGMEMGAHARTHRSLSRLPLEEAVQEIRTSKEVIERWLGAPCRHFAFPFGSTRDYNQTLVRHVREAGFDSCLLNIHGYNHFSSTEGCFKRIVMTETTDVRFLLG